MTVMSDEYINIDGVETRYILEGNGPPVVLVHGLGEFLEVWNRNISPLSQFFTVYALDLPGHGQSGKPQGDYSFNYFIEFIIHFLDQMGVEKSHFIGHSLGAAACLKIAIDYPERVSKLVIVGTGGLNRDIPLSYRLATVPGLGYILLGPPRLINRNTVKLGLKMNRYFFNPDRVDNDWIEAACRSLRRPERNETIIQMVKSNVNLANTNPDIFLTDKLLHVKAPTLAIHGAEDRVVPLHQVISALKLIPSIKIEVIDKCGHLPQIEQAEYFNEIVTDFLREAN